MSDKCTCFDIARHIIVNQNLLFDILGSVINDETSVFSDVCKESTRSDPICYKVIFKHINDCEIPLNVKKWQELSNNRHQIQIF